MAISVRFGISATILIGPSFDEGNNEIVTRLLGLALLVNANYIKH